MPQIIERGGIVIGPSHVNGGAPFILADTGTHIEEEGMEINIPREILDSDSIYTFKGSNAKVLNDILKLTGLSITDKVTTVKAGDIVICVRSAWDDKIRSHTGTLEEILHAINTSNGCNPIIYKNGGKMPVGFKPRVKDLQAINPNSDRWKKKKQHIEQLSNNIHRLRQSISRDIKEEDEKKALTALVIAIMDRTAERIGNDDSADNGHFGVTGFRKNHIHIIGNKIHLDYIGKSGTKHEKSFSDERISKALKKAIKNSPGKFIFETKDGFRIKSDKVNRYLHPFHISAKDLRGYNANKWIIDQLKVKNEKVNIEDPIKAKKERKKIFNKAVKETAKRVGHGSGTLKKHYMIPELPTQYIDNGIIIDMKNLGYYAEGNKITNENSNNMQIQILKTTAKGAMLITDGNKIVWIMPKMKRMDGTFTKGAYDALEKSDKTLQQNVEETKDIILDFCQIVRETEKAILVKMRLSFVQIQKERDIDVWFPKSKAKIIAGKLSVNSFFWKEKKAEVLGREKYYAFNAFDTYDNSYGVNAVTEELHTDQERRSKLLFPKSVSFLIDGILYVPAWIVEKRKEEKEDSMHTGAYRYVSTIHTHLNTNYEIIEPQIVACVQGEEIKVPNMEQGGITESEISEDLEENLEKNELENEISELKNDDEKVECLCFSAFIKEKNPEICEQLIEEDINSNPELRKKMDEIYKEWNSENINENIEDQNDIIEVNKTLD